MKVLHLATQDNSGGGGGFDAAYRLHCNMRSAGQDSCMVVLHKKSDDPEVVGVASHLSAVGKLRQYGYAIQRWFLRRKFRMSAYFNIDSQEVVHASRLVDMFPFQPDVIIAHWVSGFVNAATLRDLNRITGAPILWYCMDMAPFTGGCHYSFGCAGYTRQCGNCPQLAVGRGTHDLSHRQWQNKWECLKETNITVVAASSWSKSQLESGSIFRNKRHETILLGVDVDVFCPMPQGKARKKLDLPIARKIIFFGAQSLYEERKGIRYLVDALKLLHTMLGDNVTLRDQVLVVTAGKSENAAELDIAFEHRHIGFLKGDVMLAAGYQAADVFVNASIEDAGPMMINESLLCGTPVVSFEMGVAIDLVHTDKTGYRAQLRDAQDMATGLRRILEQNDYTFNAMREYCRNYGLQMCHPDVQVRAFETLCNELMQVARTGG
jgi:glycosyltransferase involved in cell wall biosynthesis